MFFRTNVAKADLSRKHFQTTYGVAVLNMVEAQLEICSEIIYSTIEYHIYPRILHFPIGYKHNN